MLLRRQPAPALRKHVTGYWGYEELTPGPMRRREGPGADIVVILTLEHDWLIDGERRDSFVGGLRLSQVTTEHAGRSCGIHVGLAPWAAHTLLRVPMHELAETTVPFEALLSPSVVERLADVGWEERFAVLDESLSRRLRAAPEASWPVVWAWERLRRTHGRLRIGLLTEELGWSRKRLVAAFREQIGLSPKAAARLLRFERARTLAGTMSWAELAFACGFADQPHLISEFRAFTGRTPETFLQDAAATAA